MFSVSVRLELSTSLTALSTTLIFSPRLVASCVILVTLTLTFDTFSILTCISSMVSAMDSSIFWDVSSRWESASMILLEDACVPLLKLRISLATTAKPFPASPALAASIEAFNASKLVFEVMPSIVLVSSFTFSNSFLKSSRICSTCFERSAILLVVSTTSTSSPALTLACSTDAPIRSTTCSIRSATPLTCVSMTFVISMEERVFSFKTPLLASRFCISFITSLAPVLFSSASSRTTVTPSTTALLASLTCSTVRTTRSKLLLIDCVSAPSDSTRCLIAILVQT